jgi:predicted Zn-dependent protease
MVTMIQSQKLTSPRPASLGGGSLGKGAMLVLATLLAGIGMGGCETNPATGESQFIMMDRNQEVQMGLEAAPQLVQESGGELTDAAIKGYVTAIGAKMAATTEGQNPSLPWKFTVLDSEVINAFALPGGQVFVSRGLMERMTNEAQLAGVIGHEIGHVTARHINDRMVQTAGVGLVGTVAASVLTEGVGGAVGEVAPQVINMGGQTVVLRYGREQELQSDELGMRYMTNVNYNPEGQRQVMQILGSSTGEPEGSEWFSTHPYPKTRIEAIDRLLATQYAGIVKDPRYVLNADQYKTNVLDRFKSLPRPRQKANAGRLLGAAERFAMASRSPHAAHDTASIGITSAGPVLWCSLCAGK